MTRPNYRPWPFLFATPLALLVAAPAVPAELVPDPPHDCEWCAGWSQPREPFRIFGNTWYVGTAGLSAILVTGPEGHILLDGALPQSATQIQANIEALGFRILDVKLIVNSHEHFDHTGGLRAYNHIGATVITHWKNFDFLNRDVINYTPRTLRPDMVSLWPPTELAEGYYFETVRENYVLTDGNRTMQIHYVNPLQHAEGMLMAYLPKEKLLLEADLVDTFEPLPARISGDQRSFFNAVQKLKLDVARLVPSHGRPIPWAAFDAAARVPQK